MDTKNQNNVNPNINNGQNTNNVPQNPSLQQSFMSQGAQILADGSVIQPIAPIVQNQVFTEPTQPTQNKQQIASQDNQKESKKEKKIIKILRMFIWLLVALFLPVGISLRKTSKLSVSYVNDTYDIKEWWGNLFFYIFLIVSILNLVWGAVRWILRIKRQKCSVGRIIGKLIGGGIWRLTTFVPIVSFSIFILAGLTGRIIENNIAIDEKNKFEQILSNESTDKMSDTLDYTISNLNSLSSDEIRKNLDIITLANIKLEDGENVSYHNSNGLFSNNTYASVKNVKKLNKAYLSEKRNFVIFYTTSGDDAVSEDNIKKLSEMLERIVENYESELNLKYQYSRVITSEHHEQKMRNILELNNISTSILNTAMPVYVADPYNGESNILASYAGTKFAQGKEKLLIKLGQLMSEDTAELYASTPSYPFINILPRNLNNDSLELVTAHELGHHYEVLSYDYYDHRLGCGGKAYCRDVDTDNYTDENKIFNEGLANWMAVQVVKNQPVHNLIRDNHHESYIKYATCEPADLLITDYEHCVDGDFKGYPMTAYLENVAHGAGFSTNAVAAKYYLIALGSERPVQALYTLINREIATDARSAENEIMLSLAEKNITNEYGNKYALYANGLPKNEKMPCIDFCTQDYTMPRLSIKYFSITSEEFANKKIIVNSKENSISSTMIGRKNNQFTVVKRGGMEVTEYDIDKEYDVLLLAVTSFSLQDEETFSIQVISNELSDVTDLDDNNDQLFGDLGNGCMLVNTNEFFDGIKYIVSGGADILHILAEQSDEDLTDELSQLDKNVEEYNSQVDETKNIFAQYSITVCGNIIKSGSNFDVVKTKIQNSMGYNMNIINKRDGTDRTSVFLGFDLFTRSGKVYVLSESNGEMGLLTIITEEK